MKIVRTEQIDILKVLCSFLVVCIHTVAVDNAIGGYVVALCRCAVPIFLIISGYFTFEHLSDKRKIKKQIKKIFFLYIFSNIMYLIWDMVIRMIKGINFIDYLKGKINLESIFKLILFNDNMFAGHLWYLGAILYVLIIVYFVGEKIKRMYFLIPGLLAFDLIFGKYSLLIFKAEFSYIYVRNFLFVGLPYFMIGLLIKQNINNQLIKQRPSSIFIIGIIMINIVERFFLVQNNINSTRDQYISTTLLSILVFLYFLDMDSIKYRIFDVFGKIGRRYSTYIYIFHPIFVTCCSILFRKVLNLDKIYGVIEPIVVYIITLLFLVIWRKCFKYLKVSA